MPTLADAETRTALLRRVRALTPTARARWGKFTPPRMVGHLTESLRMALGELPVDRKPVPWPVRHFPVRDLLIFVLPFPKGLPTAPELLTRGNEPSGAELAQEIAAFEAALGRWPARDPALPWPDHPAFGPLSARAWAVLQFRHADHHFRQFGI
ncbi:MAG: DUF1569 domain-containing protein [Gemmatimonadales bacterium]